MRWLGSTIDKVKKNGRVFTPVEKWQEALKRMSPNVARLYEREVGAFTQWLGLSLGELYELGVEAQKSGDPSERMIVVDKLVEYLSYIKENKRSERSGKIYSYGKMKDCKSAVFKFYSVNGVVFKNERGSELSKLIKRKETDFRKPTKEEIRKLISVSPLRLKAVIALQKDSGLRVSDIAQIKYKHIKEGINSQDGFGGFILRTEKTDKLALPLFGPETTYYIKQWIETFEKEEGRKLTEEDFIFPVIKNYHETKRGQKINANTLSEIINQQIEKLNLKGQISDNGLRYFFQSQLENVMNKNIILKIQGKTIGDSSSHYSKHDIEELLPLYKSAYHLLTVESSDETQKAELESLRNELEELKKFNSRLTRSYKTFRRRSIESLNTGEGEEKGEVDETITISKANLSKLVSELVKKELNK